MTMTHADIPDDYGTDVLPAGTALLGGQYVIESYLSSGGFGITYYARDSLDRRVVIKECFPEAFCKRKNRSVLARSHTHQGQFRSVVEMFVREARSIAKLSHPNIVGVHQVFQDNETAYMALDLIEGKDLLDLMEESDTLPTYKEVNAILLKLLDAIATVHDGDMLHRDISPDNILIDRNDNPVLIDFGAAREEASKKSRALSAVLVVKDGYSPQEFYIAGSQQGPCSDLYALAATFSHLISGDPPPNSQVRLAAVAAHKPDPYVPLVGRIQGYPQDFLAAIDTAMNIFAKDRIQTARDWTLRIDARARKKVALAQAKDVKDIEKTVTELIQIASELPVPEAQPKATEPVPVLAEPKRKVREIEDLSQVHAILPVPEVVEERGPPIWIERCKQKQAQAPEPEFDIPEPLPAPVPIITPPDPGAFAYTPARAAVFARYFMAAALALFILTGNVEGVMEAVIPFAQDIIILATEDIDPFA